MFKHPQNPIITPAMVTPSHDDLVVKGVLNPGAVQFGNETILLLRVAEGCKKKDGKISIPMYNFSDGVSSLTVVHLDENDPHVQCKDTRAVRYKEKEYVSTLSHLRLARSRDGVHFTIDPTPFIVPQNESEEFGVEDARIVKIDDYYYINYTAVSRDSYGTSLVRTKDFVNKEYLGMIFNAPNKDVCIFPEKINGRYVALHRPYNHDFGKCSIWIAKSPDLIHWGAHECILRPRNNKWESEKIGGGAPPIKTKNGWLEIYHGKTLRDGNDFYSLMVLLLDLKDPSKVLYQGDHPIIIPDTPYETKGFVPNVVFLNGMVQTSDTALSLYYAACDEVTCLATCQLSELLGTAGGTASD